MKKYFAFLLILTLLFAAFSVALAQEGEPIVIGASLPLTGPFSDAGSLHAEGYQLCVDLINESGGLLGRPLEIVISDNRSDVEEALSQTERFINQDEVDLLFGTFSSRLTFPVSAVAEQNGFVYPIPSGGAIRIWERGFENMFYFQQNVAEFTGAGIVGAITELVGSDNADFPATAAVVHADDFFANAIADGLLGNEVLDPGSGDVILDLAPGVIAEAGIEVVFSEQWPEEGFADWINLANSIRRSEAEYVLGLTASLDEAVAITRALETVEYRPKALYFSQGTQAEYLDAVGDAAEGVMVHTAWHPNANFEGLLLDEPFSNQDFIDAYVAANDGAQPDEDVAIPFAVCQGITQAVAAVGSTDNAELSEWLHARTAEEPVKTVLGDFHWDERGVPIGRSVLMTQWQDGELNFVFPLGEFPGTADLIYPRP